MWHDPYTVKTWEHHSGNVLIELDDDRPNAYVVRVWGLDPQAFVNGREIKQQMGWQFACMCDTLEEAMKQGDKLGGR